MIVRLEHHPLGGALDRDLGHDEQAADVDVTPARIRRERASAPDADRAAHEADRVDALRVEQVLLAAAHVVLEVQRATDDLVGGRLVDAALRVDARVHAGDVTRGGHEDVALLRIVDLDPREVVRAVLGVARLGQLVDAAVDRLGRVEDREAVLAGLAVREDRVLDGRRDLTGSRDERDLLDLLEHLQAGARARAAVLADPQTVTTTTASGGSSLGRLLAVTAG